MSLWTDHVARWRYCTLCPLSEQRSRTVLGRGECPCDVVFIGEAPGLSEDTIGLPFVGPAGKLQDGIIEAACLMSGKRPRMALTNLCCCFPAIAKAAGTNEPEHDEIVACQPRLVEFVNLCSPALIVALGALADAYVPTLRAITEGRDYVTIDHPAYIVRLKKVAQDMAAHRAAVKLSMAFAKLP